MFWRDALQTILSRGTCVECRDKDLRLAVKRERLQATEHKGLPGTERK